MRVKRELGEILHEERERERVLAIVVLLQDDLRVLRVVVLVDKAPGLLAGELVHRCLEERAQTLVVPLLECALGDLLPAHVLVNAEDDPVLAEKAEEVAGGRRRERANQLEARDEDGVGRWAAHREVDHAGARGRPGDRERGRLVRVLDLVVVLLVLPERRRRRRRRA